jgi:hypothetical protein
MTLIRLPDRAGLRIDPLLAASWLYLWGPVGLFLTTWFRPELGIPAVLLAGGAVGWLGVGMPAWGPPVSFSRFTWPGLVVLALALTWFSGIGGFTAQHGDYDKHNLIFQDLIRYPWPVHYTNPARQDPFLCYYLAYYLPVAALVKGLGLTGGWIDGVSFGWGWLGVLLVLAWVVRLSGRRGFWVAVLLLLLSGLEVPLRMAWSWAVDFKGHNHQFLTVWLTKTTAWTMPYKNMRFFFSDQTDPYGLFTASGLSHLRSSPQHMLGGWLVTALWLHGRRAGWGVCHWAVLLTPTLLWSPFVTVGLAVLILADMLAQPGSFRQLSGQLFRTNGWLLAVVAVPTGLLTSYVLAHEPVSYVGFLPTNWRQSTDLYLFLLFTGLLFVLPLWLLTRACRYRPILADWLVLARTSTWTMLGLMLFHGGYFNDFQMRSTIPGQFVCTLAVANGLTTAVTDWLGRSPVAPRNQRAQVLLWGWAILALLPTLRLISVVLTKWYKTPQWLHIANQRADASRIYFDIDPGLPPNDFAAQYLGRTDSWYWTRARPEINRLAGQKSIDNRGQEKSANQQKKR